MSNVVWHDVECGSYGADLPLWRELAAAHAGPVLDVGAGTGRVALDLAARGHTVVALDSDPELLAALRERDDTGGVETVVADARSFSVADRTFGLILVPMQTVQLLGAAGRNAFLSAARAHLAPSGLLACAITERYLTFDACEAVAALPDVRVVDGVVYASRPLALREEGDHCAIERMREITTPDGRMTTAGDVIHLDRLSAAVLEREGAAAGLTPERARAIPETDDHVASTVVMLRG